MKGEALDSNIWRNGFGRGYGSEARRRNELIKGVNGFLTVYTFK